MAGVMTLRTGLFAAASSGTIANATILDTRDLSSAVTLSGSNLVATKNNTAAHAYAFGRHGKTSGKWRFQVTVNTLGGTEVNIGVANPMFINQASYLGSDSAGAGYGSSTGAVVTNGSSTNTTAYAAGDVIDVYLDFGSNNIWFAKNGVSVLGAVGVTAGRNISGILTAVYPAVNLYYNLSAVTFNFGATAFTYASLDSSFAAWSDVEDYSRLLYRRIGIRIRSVGFFAHAIAEFMPRDTSGGASTATGGTAQASNSNAGAAANAFDANTTTYWATNLGVVGSAAPPATLNYDLGADAARSTQYLAIQGRPGGGGNEQQAPTDFIIMVGGAASWFKNSFQTTTTFAATTPGEIKEFTLS